MRRPVARRANLASAIYGQILVLSVLSAFTPADVSAWIVAVEVASTQVVFWVGEAYAETIARQVRGAPGHSMTSLVWEGMVGQWPLAQAALPTVVLMLLSMAGVFNVETALTFAFAVGVLLLFGWGFAAARKTGRTLTGQIVVGLFSGSFGLVVVFFKVLTH